MAHDAIRAAGGSLGGFWQWWTGELKGLMPGRRSSGRRLTRPYLLLTLRDNLSVLTACGRSGDVEIGRSEGDVDKALEALADRRHRKQPLIVRLEKALGLRKILDLPGSARAELDRLLFYELDRLTPFKAADVCFAWWIVEDDRKSGRIKVRIDVAPKALVEGTLEALRQRQCQPLSIALDSEDEETALDLTPKAPAQASSSGRWQRIFTALIVGLSILAVTIPLRQQSLSISQLNAEVRSVQASAEESSALREQLQALVDRSGFLIDEKNRYLPRTNVMNALVRLIPDQAYVSQLQIRDDKVVLVGHADRASELIGALERSTMFTAPKFQSPLTRDPRTGKERFQIAVDLTRTDK